MHVLFSLSASQIRKKEEMESQYDRKVNRLQQEINELQQQSGTTVDEQQTTSSPPSHSQLCLYINSLERHEDQHMKDQLKLVKDFGRCLERIEDIGCSYFKPRSARCRIQDELFRRLEKGQLHGIVKRDHLCQVGTDQISI